MTPFIAQNANSDATDDLLSGVEWRFVGPYRGGRVLAVAGVSNDTQTYFFGSAHGGVWKTKDAGLNWKNVSDRFFNFPSIGGLDVSASNPNVIYAGTGEGLQRQYISAGDGVYKSTDGGETWENVGLKETRHISRVRVHPTNPDIAFVAAMGDMFGPNPERGVYRTQDGGTTWEQVLYKGETTGSVDLAIAAQNPNIIFSSMNHHVTYPWDEESGGPTSGLFKSTDGGDTWIDVSHNPGMPTGMLGKVGIAISGADSDRIYAFVEADKAEGGIYRTDDGGASWQRVHYNPAHLEIPNSYNHITADTQDPDVVYIQSIAGLLKSSDGGKTFEKISLENWDPHALWIAPNDNQRIIEGGDGGASITFNGGETWSSLENQPTADLLSLAIDDQEPYNLYGSQNDNSHMMIPSRSDAGNIGWSQYNVLPAGEGGQTAVKPDGSVIYANDRSRMARIDQTTGIAEQISVWPEWVFGSPAADIKYRFYYSFPVLISPHDPDLLYTAAQYLFRSNDEGETWSQVSDDLTKDRRDMMRETSGGPISSNASSLFHVSLIRTIAESPIIKGELWVGTDDSTIQFSPDSGDSWHNVSPPDLKEWTTITAIEVSPHTPGTVYISGERHRVSDREPYLYKTNDYGKTWLRITNGIHKNDFTWVVREDPVRKGLLYAGAETGAYISFDDGDNWTSLQRNLPPVIVMQMQVKNNDLVVATHGRGFWVMDNIASLRQITPEVRGANAHLFEIAPALRLYGEGKGWGGRATRYQAENPPYGVLIDYSLAKEGGEVTISISEAGGDIFKEFSSTSDGLRSPTANKGMNRFRWDMRYPGTTMPSSPGALDGYQSIDYSPPSAPAAAPGKYVAHLNIDEQILEQPFEIKKDPRIKSSDADLKRQFDLLIDIRDRFTEVADTIMNIREFRDGLDSNDDKNDKILDELREIEGILTIWMGSKEHPMMWSSPGLTEKLSGLASAVGGRGSKPTDSMYEVFEFISNRLEEQHIRLEHLVKAGMMQ